MAQNSSTYFFAAILLTSTAATHAAIASDPALSAARHPIHARSHHHRTSRPVKQPSLSTSRTSPVAASATSAPAPLPNESVAAPVPHTAPETTVTPSVFQLHYPPQGDGYVTGSSPQAMDDHNAAKATGVQMTVPLPQ